MPIKYNNENNKIVKDKTPLLSVMSKDGVVCGIDVNVSDTMYIKFNIQHVDEVEIHMYINGESTILDLQFLGVDANIATYKFNVFVGAKLEIITKYSFEWYVFNCCVNYGNLQKTDIEFTLSKSELESESDHKYRMISILWAEPKFFSTDNIPIIDLTQSKYALIPIYFNYKDSRKLFPILPSLEEYSDIKINILKNGTYKDYDITNIKGINTDTVQLESIYMRDIDSTTITINDINNVFENKHLEIQHKNKNTYNWSIYLTITELQPKTITLYTAIETKDYIAYTQNIDLDEYNYTICDTSPFEELQDYTITKSTYKIFDIVNVNGNYNIDKFKTSIFGGYYYGIDEDCNYMIAPENLLNGNYLIKLTLSSPVRKTVVKVNVINSEQASVMMPSTYDEVFIETSTGTKYVKILPGEDTVFLETDLENNFKVGVRRSRFMIFALNSEYITKLTISAPAHTSSTSSIINGGGNTYITLQRYSTVEPLRIVNLEYSKYATLEGYVGNQRLKLSTTIGNNGDTATVTSTYTLKELSTTIPYIKMRVSLYRSDPYGDIIPGDNTVLSVSTTESGGSDTFSIIKYKEGSTVETLSEFIITIPYINPDIISSSTIKPYIRIKVIKTPYPITYAGFSIAYCNK